MRLDSASAPCSMPTRTAAVRVLLFYVPASATQHTLRSILIILVAACLCRAQVCELAAAAEASSEHPLARAVLEFSEARLASPEPTDQHILGWTFDFRGDSSSSGGGKAGGLHTHAHAHAHAPVTPPVAQQRAFTATFSLDDDHSGSSTPAQQQWHHAQHPAGPGSRGHSPTRGLGGAGGSIQLVDVSLASPHADSAGAFGRPRHSNGGAHGQHWSAAAGGGFYRRSSAPNSPRVAGSRLQEQEQHHHVVHMGDEATRSRVSHGGGMPSTPGRLRYLLSNGLLHVSDVEVRLAALRGRGPRGTTDPISK